MMNLRTVEGNIEMGLPCYLGEFRPKRTCGVSKNESL